jgi:hypothetical protein
MYQVEEYKPKEHGSLQEFLEAVGLELVCCYGSLFVFKTASKKR